MTSAAPRAAIPFASSPMPWPMSSEGLIDLQDGQFVLVQRGLAKATAGRVRIAQFNDVDGLRRAVEPDGRSRHGPCKSGKARAGPARGLTGALAHSEANCAIL
jgi:hypothetical protein